MCLLTTKAEQMAFGAKQTPLEWIKREKNRFHTRNTLGNCKKKVPFNETSSIIFNFFPFFLRRLSVQPVLVAFSCA